MARFWNSFWQMLETPANRLHLTFGSLLLLALVLAVYRPILPGNFLLDDWRLIDTDNALSNGELTPFNLWFRTDFTLSTFALWLQYLAWGHNPAWYHAINLLLHASGAVFLWRLLAKLKIPGAWLAAALYAVHPVCVNSVARIAEIKNTLSLPFFLMSFWAYLHYESMALYPSPENQGNSRSRSLATAWYAFALLAFVAALLAKTSTIMLPAVLIGCAAWQRGRIGRKDWLHTAPFFALSLAFGLMSVWFQKHQALFSAGIALTPQSFWQRFAVAGHLLGFYLGKALMPFNLSLVYPQWKLDATAFKSYLPHLAFCTGVVVCWWFRRSWGRHLLFGLGCFSITLFPALGFFDSQFLTRWQVSDHLQYLPLAAPVALVAAWLGTWPPKNLFRVVTLILLLGASILARERAYIFTSDEKLLRDSIAKNPDDWYAPNDLGVILAKRNDLTGALEQFDSALKINPGDANTRLNLGHVLALTGKLKEAEAQYQAALVLDPSNDSAHKNYEDLLQREGRIREAITQYHIGLTFKPDVQTKLSLAAICYQTGDAHQAIGLYHQILQFEPDNVEVLNNLAWLLATFSDKSQRDGAEAVRCAEKACALTGFKQAQLTTTLAAAYAEAGRFPEAIATSRTTIKLANDAGDQRIAAINNQLLIFYLNNKPYHTPLVTNSLGQ
jgi:Flp pilus assembly protein TadD